MRVLAVTASVVLFACGGGALQTPAGDTSSLETGGSSKDDSKDSPSPAASDAPAAAAPAASAAPASETPADSAPAAAFAHPAPSATGAIDGTAFAPKVAQYPRPDEEGRPRSEITLTEASECPAPGDAKADHARLTVVVPWQDGYKVDLSALKVSGKKGAGGDRLQPRQEGRIGGLQARSGTVTVVTAPMDKGGKGKLRIDLQSGDYVLAGDLDIEVCVAPK